MSNELIWTIILIPVLVLDLVFILNLTGVIVLPKIEIKTKINEKPVLIVLISLAILLLSVIWQYISPRMFESVFPFVAIICILGNAVAVAVVAVLARLNPSFKIKINKKLVLIGFIILLLLLSWRYIESPAECYADNRWFGPEAPEIAMDLSSDDRMAMVEYIRDHIRGDTHSTNDSAPGPDDKIYVIYGDQGWQSGSVSEAMIEMAPDRISFLMQPENDIPAHEHVYDIRFQSIKAGFVCVGVDHKHNPFYPTRSHGFHLYMWVFEKSLFGQWELFTIFAGGIV